MGDGVQEVVFDKGRGGAEGCTLILRGHLGTTAVRELRDAALEALASGGPVVLDCRELEFVGGAALQVLLGLQRELQRRGGALMPAGLSEDVTYALSLAGVGPAFEAR